MERNHYTRSEFEGQPAEEFIGLDGLGEFPEWQHVDDLAPRYWNLEPNRPRYPEGIQAAPSGE
jgi:hypothetical protein